MSGAPDMSDGCVRLVSYGEPDQWRGGIALGPRLYDLEAATRALDIGRPCRDLAGFLAAGVPADLADQLDGLTDRLESEGAVRALDGLKLGPPVPAPEKIICIGLNYHDHAAEVGAEPPNEPIFFAKFANSLIGPRDPIWPPRETSKLDYECELAVVIGREGRRITERDALDHVAGAMVLNDVSARDLQLANQLWTGGKAIDTFAPCGPAITPMRDIADLQNLPVVTRLNGEMLQNGSTASMIFSVAEIIAFLSRIMTLRPGDIIATGTPAGVAAAHDPPRFMRMGDVVTCEIGPLGALDNPVAEPR